MTFSSLALATMKKMTRREKFLAEMEAVVPWSRLLALIEPHYPKMGGKGGRPAMPLEVMQRIYCLQQWYALSDPLAEESLYDSDAMRRFAGLELGDAPFPDEITICQLAGHVYMPARPELPPPAGTPRAERGDLCRGERVSGRKRHEATFGHDG